MPENELPYVYTRRLPPPCSQPVGANVLEDVYDFDIKNGELIVVKVGCRNPQEEVDAAKTETIQELLQRMPGRTPLAKVKNAVGSGVIPFEGVTKEEQKTYDTTEVPNSVVEAQQLLKKTRATVASLPSELKASDTDYTKVLEGLSMDRIFDYVKSKMAQKPNPDNSGEDKK